MNYSSIKYFCTVNGEGITTSLFVSGCDLHCKGCFNQEAWSFESGKELTDELITKMFNNIERPYVNGLSILGGEPLAEKNLEGVLDVIKRFRENFGNTKKLWLWTGRYLSELDDKRKEIISYCDYVVDGRFELDKADTTLKFRGSSNQTIWENKDGEFIKSELN